MAGSITDQVADAMLDAYAAPMAELQHIGTYELPSPDQVARVVEQCRALMFPGYVGPSVARLPRTELRDFIRERLDELRNTLRRQVYRALLHKQQLAQGTRDETWRVAGGGDPTGSAGGAGVLPRGIDHDCPDCAASAEDITARFLAALPALRQTIALDVRAAYEGDPAASGIDEVLFCYPGTYAISVYRIAHALVREGAVLIPRMMTELAHQQTGIDIHPGATIGRSFFIDHGTGVVIGETTLIGDRVRLYQGVTLGALSVQRADHRPGPPGPDAKRHPTLEDDVVIYAGATILGGDTVIGKGAVIGGNAWVTASVPPGATVAGAVQRR
jgi:serine O-acetyltransferase